MPGYFVFAIHFHQPWGQLKKVLDRIFENSYKLLLDVFREFSDLKYVIHVSGPLLLYAQEYYPEWLNGLAKLGEYGVAEFLAGSYGEAILPILPSGDRDLQLKEYLRLAEKLIGVKPKGAWLPERVWEPILAEHFARNGIEYVLLDDSIYYKTNRAGGGSLYPWLTEESGSRLKVFFIDTELRYVLPWEEPVRVIDFMKRKLTGLENPVIVWGSDAEKFGEWRDPAWARWWLREFLSRMRFERDIVMEHLSEYLKKHGVRGLIYLPPGSYDKMLEWSGGFFRNFIVKYAEVNNMHKKMLRVRSKLVRANVPEDSDAWKKYMLAQCNDAYWHGLFGGVYLSHLRQAIYESYIYAERIAEEAIGSFKDGRTYIGLEDFDYDGLDEVIIENRDLNIYIDPGDGGTIFELDVKKPGLEHNLQDTMSRYREPYLENMPFNPDWYRRVSGRIHVWSMDTGINDWIWNTPFKDLSDLALKKHYVSYRSEDSVELTARGGYYVFGNRIAELEVSKKVKILSNGVLIDYTLRNVSGGSVVGKLGIEYHIAPKLDRFSDREVLYRVEGVEKTVREQYTGSAKSVSIKSPVYPDIVLSADRSVEIWVSPLNTIARTEKGLLEMFQGLAVQFLEGIELKQGDEKRLSIRLEIAW
ncbi:alpha-amylase/4-alpha-glucanotransferase domain-containing protein [Thermogladius sp. 4427co]|uniref:alpha-amylase/4-alpha-glucanotransferase domain-containing protein n=1 Tax=Thermogladius sp. 4427co TaxID=3450718 RepID=UPI003F7944C1